MKPKTSAQTPNGGGSTPKTNYATGSGSRPSGGKYKIQSSAPATKQKIR